MVLRTPRKGEREPCSVICYDCGRSIGTAAYPGDLVVCPHCGATYIVARDKVWIERETTTLVRVPTKDLEARVSEIANGEFHPLDALRPEVAWFALFMEEKLRFNDMKGGLREIGGDDVADMFARAQEEMGEAFREILAYCSCCGCSGASAKPEAAFRELADTANFLMMTALALHRKSNPFASIEEVYRDLTQKARMTNALRDYAENAKTKDEEGDS